MSNCLRAGSASFPRTQSASSWSLLRIPFKVSCRSLTAVADGLVLVELDGGLPSLCYRPLPFGLNFDKGLRGI